MLGDAARSSQPIELTGCVQIGMVEPDDDLAALIVEGFARDDVLLA
jgi:hypothetical protein